jgi:hypothetical protein
MLLFLLIHVLEFTNVNMLHVHPLLGNESVIKFPRRQILGKQSVAWLRNNSDNQRSAFCAVSANEQNCKHV